MFLILTGNTKNVKNVAEVFMNNPKEKENKFLNKYIKQCAFRYKNSDVLQ